MQAICIWSRLCVDWYYYPMIRSHGLGWHRNSSSFNIWKWFYGPAIEFLVIRNLVTIPWAAAFFSQLWYSERRKETRICWRSNMCWELSKRLYLLYFISLNLRRDSCVQHVRRLAQSQRSRRRCEHESGIRMQAFPLSFRFIVFAVGRVAEEWKRFLCLLLQIMGNFKVNITSPIYF